MVSSIGTHMWHLSCKVPNRDKKRQETTKAQAEICELESSLLLWEDLDMTWIIMDPSGPNFNHDCSGANMCKWHDVESLTMTTATNIGNVNDQGFSIKLPYSRRGSIFASQRSNLNARALTCSIHDGENWSTNSHPFWHNLGPGRKMERPLPPDASRNFKIVAGCGWQRMVKTACKGDNIYIYIS